GNGGTDNPTPFSRPVSKEAQEQSERDHGKSWTSSAFTLQDIQDKTLPEGLSENNAKALLDKLNGLLTRITETGPPQDAAKVKEILAQVKFYLSNDPANLEKDPETGLPNVASSIIGTKPKVYLHVIDFWNQPDQPKILYHEIKRHIADNEPNEIRAMGDTQEFAKNITTPEETVENEPYREPGFIERAKGVHLWDGSGKRYLDLVSQTWSLPLGHNNPGVIRAVRKQLNKITHLRHVYDTKEKDSLTEKIIALAPEELTKVNFVLHGSLAVEGAMKLAINNYENRDKILYFEDGFHGRSFATMGISWKLPDSKYKNYFINGIEVKKDLRDIEDKMAGVRPAAIIIELVQGNGGCRILDKELVMGIRELCDKYDVTMIVDEIQTAFGCVEKMFLCEDYGITPDIIVFGKAIGGGFPLAGSISKSKYAFRPGEHSFTFSDSPISIAAGLAFLEELEPRLKRVSKLNLCIQGSLRKLEEKYRFLRGARSIGVKGAVDIVDAAGNPDCKTADLIVSKMLERGIIIAVSRYRQLGNAIMLQPPLIITFKELKSAFDALEDVLNEIYSQEKEEKLLYKLPEAITKRYEILDLIRNGGSSAATFLVRDSQKREVILKYSDWAGIGSNGMEWLKAQYKRLRQLRESLPPQGAALIPQVYDYRETEEYVFYTHEHLRNTEPLPFYFLRHASGGAQAFLDAIGNLLDLFSQFVYSQGKLDAPDDYVEKTHLKRIDYRLGLFANRDTEVYERLIKGRLFSIGGKQYQDISYLFEDLFNRETIYINGKKYPNLPELLEILKSQPELLERLHPGFIPEYTHGDLLLRNILRSADGSLHIIDVRGVDLPENAPSRIDITYELGKVAHSFLLELVRNNLFDLDIQQENGDFYVGLRYKTEYPAVVNFLKARDIFPEFLKRHPALAHLLKDEPYWLEKTLFAEATHFITDAVNRLSQDTSGKHSLAYYAIGTKLLYGFLVSQGISFNKDITDSALSIAEGPGQEPCSETDSASGGSKEPLNPPLAYPADIDEGVLKG
ncbi:MAG: aspartate aminotransferase family protein, partial [Candidatus Omnitrophota bacterium]|nr:aspartate aminotransferase family protein [Candidatus Omnitrophota bacterium]